MADFTFDTSGEVGLSLAAGVPFEVAGGHSWYDLSPFAQGYVEGAKRSFLIVPDKDGDDLSPTSDWGFYDLHPEALDMILRDCEVLARRVGYMTKADAGLGALVWAQRQGGEISDFPPLRVYLDDAGKVRLAALPTKDGEAS